VFILEKLRMLSGHMKHRKVGPHETQTEVSSDENSVQSFVKILDLHPKLEKTAEKRSSKGGLVSLIALLITIWLIHSEVSEYMIYKTKDSVTVDLDLEKPDELIKVYLEIEFPTLPCAVLSLDVVDKDGEQQPLAQAHIVRSRMQGKEAIGHLSQIVRGSEAIPTSTWVPPDDYCGSCYDVEKIPNHKKICCNTCLELKRAYIAHGLPPAVASSSEQCLRELKKPKLTTPNEGCRIHGHLEVQPSRGNFHIAAGRANQVSHMSHQHHIHQLTPMDLVSFNITHKIKFLSFGRPLARYPSPLKDVEYFDQKLSQTKYFLQVVPLIQQYSSSYTGVQEKYYVYSASQFTQYVEITSNHFPVPGVFFYYDFSALQINSIIQKTSLFALITRVCAMVGGMFVVLGLLYRMFDYILSKVFGIDQDKVNSIL
jgi:endoplasmic reticulum-Golgi intermediate compartment protein 3